MAEPVRLAEGVWRLPTLGTSAINSFAFEEPGGGITLVDAGLRGADRRLLRHLQVMGRTPHDVRRIIATHAHFDHVGGARGLRESTGGRVCIHEEDAQYCRSGRAPKLDQGRALGRILSLFPQRIGGSEVDETFSDNQLLDVAGGLRVIHTPGHSPGHCSLLHEPSGVLITGDALFNWRSRMRFSYAYFCSDIKQNRETAARLGEVDYEIAAFTHGPEIRENARDAVRGFLRSQGR